MDQVDIDARCKHILGDDAELAAFLKGLKGGQTEQWEIVSSRTQTPQKRLLTLAAIPTLLSMLEGEGEEEEPGEELKQCLLTILELELLHRPVSCKPFPLDALKSTCYSVDTIQLTCLGSHWLCSHRGQSREKSSGISSPKHAQSLWDGDVV